MDPITLMDRRMFLNNTHRAYPDAPENNYSIKHKQINRVTKATKPLCLTDFTILRVQSKKNDLGNVVETKWLDQ